MKQLRFTLSALAVLVIALGFTACDGDSNEPLNGYYETTDDDAETLVLKGLVDWSEGFSVFKPDGFDNPFYIQDGEFYGKKYEFAQVSASRLDELTSVPSSWEKTVAVEDQAAYWAKYSTYTAYTYVRFRVALIDGNDVTIEYVVDSSTTRPNTNANTSSEDYASNWEMPAFNDDNYYLPHTVEVDGEEVLNYAIEWNNDMKHAEWVAFYFDTQTCQDNVSRTNAWAVDPLLSTDMQTDNSYHTSDGYDRGHLCASEDRVWLEEANEQTFYYSNMSPQISTFNQNFWADLETVVRTWGRSTAASVYDKVYVAKGGTLNNLLINFTGVVKAGDGLYPTTDENGFTSKGLACPAYYFMAVVAETDDTFQGIAFLVPHSEDLPSEPTSDEIQEYVVSIDYLETFSGLDLFCNLPDDIEDEVEASYDISDWAW